MDLFDRIKILCEEKDVSIAKLEQETGLSNGSIRKWSNTIPSGDRLAKVADYFNVSTDYLLGRQSERSLTSYTIDGIENPLTEEELNAVYAFIESYRKFQRDQKDKG